MRRAKTLIGRRFLLQRLDALSFPTHWALLCVAMLVWECLLIIKGI